MSNRVAPFPLTRRGARGIENKAAAETAVAGDAALGAEFEFLNENIADIEVLRSAAEQTPLQAADLESIPVFQRGPIGLALANDDMDLLNRQLLSWATYFSKHIDNLLQIQKLLKAGELDDPNAVELAYGMSVDILGALDRTISVRLAS